MSHTISQPLAQDYSVIFHNPNPEYYVEGSGLIRLGDGEFLAVVPVAPIHELSKERRVDHSVVHILASRDHGGTWSEISSLPYYSAVPWQHEEVIYLFANKGGTEFRNDDLILLKSLDHGQTWSEPVTLFRGHYWNCHTGMAVRGDYLYWAVDDLSFGAARGPAVVSGHLASDLMDPGSWRISNSVPYPGIPIGWENPRFSHFDGMYLEPNVVNVRGSIRVFATVKHRYQTTASICAILDLTDEGSTLSLKFTQFSAMPGGQLKFAIIWDEVSKMFWATANLVVDSQGAFDWWEKASMGGRFAYGSGGNDRRFLMLFYSLDAMNWIQAGCIAQAAKVSQSFMYARPVIDGEDLAVIARSSINAPNQHDADHATFHRVRDFRSLALNLFPSA